MSFESYPLDVTAIFLNSKAIKYLLPNKTKTLLARAFDSMILWGALNSEQVLRQARGRQTLLEQFNARRVSILTWKL